MTKEERKEYMRKYYAEHKKKIIEQNKNYYKEHKMDMIQKNNEKNNETLKTANNHYQHWTYEEIKTLESLIDKNISRKEIANKLGRSYFSIKNTITKLRKEKRINNENN